MKKAFVKLTLLALACLALCACGTRSISNSGFDDGNNTNPFYYGELNENDVLGIDSQTPPTEKEIAKQLASAKAPHIPMGGAIMVVQSGAMIPDTDMLEALDIYYDVAVFSGTPDSSPHKNYARSLRLAAARAGCDLIMVYWGILETAQTSYSSKAISWVPIIGNAIPDESQQMRIRLKVALIDTKTGHWDSFVPATFEDNASSSRHSRKNVDQRQINILKTKAYRTAVNELVKRYSRERG